MDMSYDLSFTARKGARGACFKGQHCPQIGVGRLGKILSDFLSSSVADPEDLVERANGELLIGRDRSPQQTLRVAQFHSEDVEDETANVFCARNADFEVKRIGVLLKELVPAAGLSVVVVHQFLKADPYFHVASLSRNSQKFVEETNQVLPNELVDNNPRGKEGRNEAGTDRDCLEQDQTRRGHAHEAQRRGDGEPDWSQHKGQE